MQNRCKKALIYFICFVVVMITPAFAEQVNSSTPTTTTNVNMPNNLKINNPLPTPSQKTVKTVSSQQNVENSNQNNYADIIHHANEILPEMQKSYQNTTEEIAYAQNALVKLEKQNEKATIEANKLKNELDNFEISTNNSEDYKELKKKYNEYNTLTKNIKATELKMADLKQLLNKKKDHTGKCVTSLKQIKKSENIPVAVNTYNNNMDSLIQITNNLQVQFESNNDIILSSNNTNQTTNTTTNSTNTTSNIDHDSTTKNALWYTGVAATPTGGALLVTGVIAALFLKTGTLSWTGVYGPAIYAYIFETFTGDFALTVSTVTTLTAVTWTVVAVAAVIALAGLACFIAYYGEKRGWWQIGGHH